MKMVIASKEKRVVEPLVFEGRARGRGRSRAATAEIVGGGFPPGVRKGQASFTSSGGTRERMEPLGGGAKRAMDVVLASLALVVLMPIMLSVAALVRLLMPGPALFAHPRVGFDGRTFLCYKFRTMVVDGDDVLRRHLAADAQAAEEWRTTRKLRNDPRVGCLGNILRKSSLDELPQLFNVLRGDMSLVGPRPVVSDELDHYGRHASAYLGARPGMTGVWQTTGRNRVSYAARVARDRYYVRNWSLRLDLVLMLRTIPAIMNFDQTS